MGRSSKRKARIRARRTFKAVVGAGDRRRVLLSETDNAIAGGGAAALSCSLAALRRQPDADPIGRRQAGKGHCIYRGVENPNEVIIQREFPTAEQATAYR